MRKGLLWGGLSQLQGAQLDVLMVSDSTVSLHEEAASNRESREAGRVANS